MKKILGLLTSQTSKDTLISMIGLAGTAIIGFIYTVILARYLEPSFFGVYSSLTALASIIYSVGDFGFTSAVINFLPKLKEKKQLVINTGFTFQFLAALGFFAAFVIVSFFNNVIIPGSLSYQLILAGVLTFNYLIFNLVQSIFTSERRFWRISISQILDSGIKISLVFILLYSSKLSIASAITANIISSLLALVITFWYRFAKIRFKIDKPIFSSMFVYAKWIAVSRVFTVMVSKIDVLLVNLLIGSFQAGIYSAANRVTLVFALLISSLNSVVNPRFSSFNTKEKVQNYIHKLFAFVALFAILMAIVAILAGPLITFVFGEKYILAIPVFRALTFSMVPFIFSIVITPPLLYSYGQSSLFAKVAASQVVAMIILEIILLPILGVYATAVALGSTNAIATIFLGIKLRNLLRHDPPQVLA
jgi:O-antigen/teichoic acid export membrane protein